MLVTAWQNGVKHHLKRLIVISMRKLNYTEGDRVVCVEETSGQGGVVKAEEMCAKCAEESNTDIPERACMVH